MPDPEKVQIRASYGYFFGPKGPTCALVFGTVGYAEDGKSQAGRQSSRNQGITVDYENQIECGKTVLTVETQQEFD